jgi:hypothetical protein
VPSTRPRSSNEVDHSPAGAVDEERRLQSSRIAVQANARLTGQAAAVLVVLLAVEGLTLVSVHRLVTLHVFVGMLLIPPVLLKIASTGWRFVRYYAGDPAYRQKGPPPLLLRLLGPIVVVLTVVVFGSGIALLLTPSSLRNQLLFVHKASFVLWFGAMTIHVLAHILETARLAPADILRRTRNEVRGAGARVWTVAGSLVIGAILGIVMLPTVGHWLAYGGPRRGG